MFKESHGECGEDESTLQLILDQKTIFEADSLKNFKKTRN